MSENTNIGQPIQFQLIPISESSNKPVVGEVIERIMKEGVVLAIGRLVLKEGQQSTKGNKLQGEDDIWFNSKVVSRSHAELWVRENRLYIRDIGSSSGTFLNKMRLSPSGKESRPYSLKQGDIIQFGVDFKGRAEDLYKCVTVKIGFHDQSWIQASRKSANHIKFRSALKSLLEATNPYSSSKLNNQVGDNEENSTDCCICIGPIAPYQALFVAPCSHCYHFKCVSQLVIASPMFQCPLCRQVANLTASVSMESLVETDFEKDRIFNQAYKEIDDHKANNLKSSNDQNYQTELMKKEECTTKDNEPPKYGVAYAYSPQDGAEISSTQRTRSQSACAIKRPSLTIRMAELLGRQNPSSSGQGSFTQNIPSSRLIPRLETPQFTRPSLNEEDSNLDFQESIS